MTSDIDYEYNCIAWAAGDDTQQWWPVHGYWPPDVRRVLSVEAFGEACAALGYGACEGADRNKQQEKGCWMLGPEKPWALSQLSRKTAGVYS